MTASAAAWDLTALVNAADARAPMAERHLWLVRLMEWLRHAPATSKAAASAALASRTPLPLLRLRHLLHQLDLQPAFREQVKGLLAAFWRDIDAAALFADFGFGSRLSLRSDLVQRIRQRLLPGTPETSDLAQLFQLLFVPEDAAWIEALDDDTLARCAALLAPDGTGWRSTLLDAMTILVSAVHASGYTPAMRQRMDRALLANEPFRQLTRCSEALRQALLEGRQGEALRESALLRALLDACRQSADSVVAHLEAYGVSVDIVYELDQLRERTARIEMLIDTVLAPEPRPEMRRLVVALLRVQAEQRGLGEVLGRHYRLLARQVAERSAETGQHYITRDRAGYEDMLRRAAGGGAVIAGTVFAKFAIAAIGLSAFWSGVWSGVNYAASFVIVMLLHWTVATKQPAMTAAAMAASLPSRDIAEGVDDRVAIENFVDRVTQLIRSQAAGIFGNLMVCGPLVLLVQVLAGTLFGAPLIGAKDAEYVLHSLTLLGPTALFAAFTGVLLFASSLIAGWTENWFVFHRLDSAIAWNPRIVARLGAARAARWAAWWRANVSGIAANVSLGMMLGLVPALLAFIGLPIEVRHVTLSTGQLAAALGALGVDVLARAEFWWCAAGIVVIGALNLTVSFGLAFAVALRSRGLRLPQRQRVLRAIRVRLLSAPLSFVLPPR